MVVAVPPPCVTAMAKSVLQVGLVEFGAALRYQPLSIVLSPKTTTWLTDWLAAGEQPTTNAAPGAGTFYIGQAHRTAIPTGDDGNYGLESAVAARAHRLPLHGSK
ncbi:MAG: hypothetical protein WBE14_09035 [Xanthobacteraceae bacterium]